jgi:hypothetical protein
MEKEEGPMCYITVHVTCTTKSVIDVSDIFTIRFYRTLEKGLLTVNEKSFFYFKVSKVILTFSLPMRLFRMPALRVFTTREVSVTTNLLKGT